MKALAKPLQNQLNVADVIFINKVDEASPQLVQEVRDSLAALGVNKTIVATSATAGINLDQAVQAMAVPQ